MNKVCQGQSFIDVVIQQSGSYEEVLNAAILNGRSITDDVKINDIINISRVINLDILIAFKGNTIATNVNTSEIYYPEGVDYMIIEETFIVN